MGSNLKPAAKHDPALEARRELRRRIGAHKEATEALAAGSMSCDLRSAVSPWTSALERLRSDPRRAVTGGGEIMTTYTIDAPNTPQSIDVDPSTALVGIVVTNLSNDQLIVGIAGAPGLGQSDPSPRQFNFISYRQN